MISCRPRGLAESPVFSFEKSLPGHGDGYPKKTRDAQKCHNAQTKIGIHAEDLGQIDSDGGSGQSPQRKNSPMVKDPSYLYYIYRFVVSSPTQPHCSFCRVFDTNGGSLLIWRRRVLSSSSEVSLGHGDIEFKRCGRSRNRRYAVIALDSYNGRVMIYNSTHP